MPTSDSTQSQRLKEVILLFLKLGVTAFGGPAAHIALMHAEVVKRRKWLSEGEFLDLLGATNLIPGPNSTEMVIHLSFLRAGWPGLILGGISFILPAMLIVSVLAALYIQYGSLPQVGWLLYGVKPVVIVIILQALWSLGRRALKTPLLAGLAVVVMAGYFFKLNEIALMFGGGLVYMLIKNVQNFRPKDLSAVFVPFGSAVIAQAATQFSLPLLFFIFLKIGALLYGSGYVLLAFLRSDLVLRFGWLTETQLIDAIAIGQVTPGPVFTTATFIGYILGGTPGALLATLGIFLPSFIYVAISNPFIPKMRQSARVASLLDGVNVASLGLMAAVTWQLGRASIIDPLTIIITLVTAVLLFHFKVNSTWLIAGGALVGLLSAL
ncbi:MAG: chromate transporter [Chloroflexi bacterium HGW-Chloroflexi-10]|nr:MAG: chromate transporter [Chloroflexi bacterium HGW-Chloroflexi-10]